MRPSEAADRFTGRVDARDPDGRERSELLDILAALVGDAETRTS